METLSLDADTVVIENSTVPVNEVLYNLRILISNQGIMDFNALIQGSPHPVLNGDGLALFRIVKPQPSPRYPDKLCSKHSGFAAGYDAEKEFMVSLQLLK